MRDGLRTIEGYEIIGELGRGGFATVYEARQVRLGRRVALKEFDGVDGIDSKPARRFVREARAAGSLTHPNVVSVYDHFVQGDVLYISMELVPGGSLRRYVGRDLSTAQIGGILAGVLSGLAHAAEHDLVHRDLKPENLMVSAAGTIKIADFGIAKASQLLYSRDFVTAPGGLVGTPRYMAPEQALSGQVGAWTDLYAVGLIAWELWVGRLPYPGFDNAMQQMYHQLENPVPRADVEGDVAPAYADWIERLVKKDVSERTQSAETALEELDALLTEDLGPRWEREARLPVNETPRPPADLSSADLLPLTPTDPSPPTRSEDFEAGDAQQSTAARRRFHVPAVLYAAVPLAIVAVVLAIVLPSSGDDPKQPTSGAPVQAGTPKALQLSAGELRASAAGTWRAVDDAPGLTGLKLSSQIAAAPSGRSEDGVVVLGMAPKSANNPRLLPDAFLDGLGLRRGLTPDRERVSLGDGLAAYHYAALRPAKLGRTVDVYTAPTSAGVATVACIAPVVTSAEFTAACDAVARSVHPSDSAALTAASLGPDPEFAKRLSAALTRLARTSRSGRKALHAAASDQKGYRAAADTVAEGFRTARRAIDTLKPGPVDVDVTADLTEALKAAESSYRKLSTTASRAGAETSANTADAAARAAKSADKALGRVIGNGYAGSVGPRIPATSVPHIEALPTPDPGSSTPTDTGSETGSGSGSGSGTGSSPPPATTGDVTTES